MSASGVGIILLAIWLIFQGAIALFSLSFQNMGLIMALLALVAGICLLIGELR